MTSKIVRIFTNYEVVNESQMLGRDPNDLRLQGIEVIFNRSGKADLVVVFNTVSKPRWVFVPKGKLLKVLQEPIIRNPLTHLFTYHHSSIFDLVLTHTPDQNDPRQVRSIPYLGSFVDPTEVKHQPFDEKNQMISVISSTLRLLPGHRTRADFIDNLLNHFPNLELHTFGRGRKQELDSKIDGLRNYRFSIAIENENTPSWITEKFYDCIIAGSVPLYFGASDIIEYFPPDSFIQFPINNETECLSIINSLSKEDYERRIPALIEARTLIREKYSIAALITAHLAEGGDPSNRDRHYVGLFRFDGFIIFIQKFGLTVHLKNLIQRIRKLIPFI